jgi:hypothetical protein
MLEHRADDADEVGEREGVELGKGH